MWEHDTIGQHVWLLQLWLNWSLAGLWARDPTHMPGKWVGGKGSIASPLKGQVIEGHVTTEGGNACGTILIKVKRLYAPGTLGRFVLADFVSASDKRYREFVGTKKGKLTVTDGSYHFCRGGPPEECVAAGQADVVVHIGKWRIWKEDDLAREAPENYEKEAKALITRYLKSQPADMADVSDLPWPQRQGVLNLKRATPGSARDKPDPPAEKGGDDVKRAKKAQISDLKKQLARLKEEVGTPSKKRKTEADEGSTPVKKKKKKTVEEESNPFSNTEGIEGVDWGGPDDDPPDPSDDDDSSDEESEYEETTEEEKSKKKKKKRRSSSDRDKKDKKDEKEKKTKKEKSKKKKKKKKKKEKVLEKDKGPFGVGETKRLPKQGSGSGDDEESSSSGDSNQSFRKAPSGLTLHLRLQRYAMKHPGRLATRLLKKMEAATRFEGALLQPGKKEEPPRPCALNYFLAILTPTLRERWSPRTQREMRIWSEVLDQLAAKRVGTAADIVCQRLKALEQSVQDGNNWKKAKFLELVAEETSLADKGEEQMMVKEAELEDRFRSKPQEPVGRIRAPRKGRMEKEQGSAREKERRRTGRRPKQRPRKSRPREEGKRGPAGLTRASWRGQPWGLWDPWSFPKGCGNRRWKLGSVLASGLPMSHVGAMLLDFIGLLDTPLGNFWPEFERHTVAQGKPAACTEVLPVSIRAVRKIQGWSKG